MRIILLVPFFAASLVYLLFAFSTWDFNPGNWLAEWRVMCSVFMAVAFAFVLLPVLERTGAKR